MEVQALGGIFQKLFSHETCSILRYSSKSSSLRRLPNGCPHVRGFAAASRLRSRHFAEGEDLWQQRTNLFPPDKSKEFERYPLVTAEDLKSWTERPRRVKMLTRDFIEDSLYNPNYGYFPQQAVIFNSGQPFDFNGMRSEEDFFARLSQRYTEFEDSLDAKAPNIARQLWHTPTELFRPHYGAALARCLAENYLITHHPYHDLVIYEMGAGNGTLMLNILDHLREAYPEVYERTRFRLIEIAPALAAQQRSQLQGRAGGRGHAARVEVIEGSIFDWKRYVPEPCWFIALEVVDNFAHDAVRYDHFTGRPYQGMVLIDAKNDFYEFYTPDVDPVVTQFLRARDVALGERPKNHPLNGAAWLRRLRANLPLAENLTVPEYVPTRLMQFFEGLRQCFPLHRLLLSDFSTLPDPATGMNAPAVQTRYERRTVPVTTPLVHQGFFDIIFPTDFDVAKVLYQTITGKFTRVMTHRDYLTQWAYVEDTETMNGDNPMLSWYKNASVMVTV